MRARNFCSMHCKRNKQLNFIWTIWTNWLHCVHDWLQHSKRKHTHISCDRWNFSIFFSFFVWLESIERIARTRNNKPTQIYSEQNADGRKQTQWKMKREPSQPTQREQCMERFELFKTENNDARSERKQQTAATAKTFDFNFNANEPEWNSRRRLQTAMLRTWRLCVWVFSEIFF